MNEEPPRRGRLCCRLPHALERLSIACIASILLYVALFAVVLDRPLSFGWLRHETDARVARGAAIEGPKLVILAGSNGPYSHRCAIIGPLLDLPCVNAGVAVGIGLDYMFARWRPLLHPGDVVYMPMEEAQYVRNSAANALGPDAAIMLRHDRATLARLPPQRWLGAVFCYDLRGALMAVIETALAAGDFRDPRAAVTGESNAMGDHMGHTAALALMNASALQSVKPWHPTAAQIHAGYGSVLIAGFLDWSAAHGVTAIGGLPTGFDDSPIPDATIAAIRAIYEKHGARFLELPNRSRYPRGAFFDTADHLNESWQAVHSASVACGLAPVLAGLPHVMASNAACHEERRDEMLSVGQGAGSPSPTSQGIASSLRSSQ
jgi:hypothetical protein